MENNIEKSKEVLCSFIQEMNKWEIASGITSKRTDISWDERMDIIRQEANLIATRFLTVKERKTSFPYSLSWGCEGSYKYTPDAVNIAEVQIKSKSKIIIRCEDSSNDKDIDFVLLLKNGNWLIDSAKYKFKDEDKWQTYYL